MWPPKVIIRIEILVILGQKRLLGRAVVGTGLWFPDITFKTKQPQEDLQLL